MPATKRYVVGFLFCRDEVLLIEKARPTWQAGRLNGVGGHVEDGETYAQAMQREFLEETGIQSTGVWERFAHLSGDDSDPERMAAGGTLFEVAFFRADAGGDDRPTPRADTDERLRWCWVKELENVLPNLHWLIPLAYRAHRYDWPLHVIERCTACANERHTVG